MSAVRNDDRHFRDLTLAGSAFANVRLASARFDDVGFSNAEITSNCNFNGMRIAGVGVKDLFAAYKQQKARDPA